MRGELPVVESQDEVPGPIAELESEHRVIQRVVAGLTALEATVREGHHVEPALLRRIAELLESYADRLHHGKEEALLFPMLEQRGVPAVGCPVGALIGEHKKGRALRADFVDAIGLFEAGSAGAREQLSASMNALVGLYPDHIWKEDYLLFPLTAKVLTPADLQTLSLRFEALNREFGEDNIRHFASLANELSTIVSGQA